MGKIIGKRGLSRQTIRRRKSMADYRENQVNYQAGTQSGAVYDEGLRSYMLGVYNYMALGIAATAVGILAIGSSPEIFNAVRGMYWLFFIGLIAMGWFGPNMIINSRSTATAHAAFWIYAALWSLAIAPTVNIYLGINPNIVFQAFAITAGMFGAMSIIGYTTKRDLSGIGQFAVMALIGLLIAALVNVFFIGSIGFSLFVSAGFVLLISAITAWETQMIKNFYNAGDTRDIASRKSIFGAFMLYGSFISMFINILQLLGFMSGDD